MNNELPRENESVSAIVLWTSHDALSVLFEDLYHDGKDWRHLSTRTTINYKFRKVLSWVYCEDYYQRVNSYE